MIEIEEIIRQYPANLQKKEFYDVMIKEYLHHQMLKSLFNNKKAEKISFLGGTALRYFYGIKRFSEDLDFDCFNLTEEEFEEMTIVVKKDLQKINIDVAIEKKNKNEKLKAFRSVFVFPEMKYRMGLTQQREAKTFIKIEAEPQHYMYQPEVKILNGFEIITPVKITPLDILFSTKIAATLKRKKDRDFFDFIFLSAFSKPDFGYLKQKLNILDVAGLKQELLMAAHQKKLETKPVFDCEHMLFNKADIEKIRSFPDYLKSFDFSRFES